MTDDRETRLTKIAQKAADAERQIAEHASEKASRAQQKQSLEERSKAHRPEISKQVEKTVAELNSRLDATAFKLAFVNQDERIASPGFLATVSAEMGTWGIHFHVMSDGKLRTVDTAQQSSPLTKSDRDLFADHEEFIAEAIASFVEAAIEKHVKAETHRRG